MSDLKSIVSRIENLEEEKAALAADIKDIFAEAKSTGFDTKVLRRVIRLRRKNKAERALEEEQVQLYLSELEK